MKPLISLLTHLGMTGHTWTCYLSLMNISIQKIKEIDALLPGILMIKEFSNLIEQEHFDL